MRALLPQLIVLGFVLWACVCFAASEGDGRIDIWRPTPEHPLTVSFVVQYNNSGNGGLNNIMWMVVKATAGG